MSKIFIELLPCPFCGADAKIEKYDYDMGHEHIPGYKITCSACRAQMTDEAFCQTLQTARDNVIKSWNNRPTIKPCSFCFSAAFDSELDELNDYGSRTIGKMPHDYRLMFSSGCGLPPRIEFDEYDYDIKEWRLRLGSYFPKFCPECGRKITEYQDKIK